MKYVASAQDFICEHIVRPSQEQDEGSDTDRTGASVNDARDTGRTGTSVDEGSNTDGIRMSALGNSTVLGCLV